MTLLFSTNHQYFCLDFFQLLSTKDEKKFHRRLAYLKLYYEWFMNSNRLCGIYKWLFMCPFCMTICVLVGPETLAFEQSDKLWFNFLRWKSARPQWNANGILHVRHEGQNSHFWIFINCLLWVIWKLDLHRKLLLLCRSRWVFKVNLNTFLHETSSPELLFFIGESHNFKWLNG